MLTMDGVTMSGIYEEGTRQSGGTHGTQRDTGTTDGMTAHMGTVLCYM